MEMFGRHKRTVSIAVVLAAALYLFEPTKSFLSFIDTMPIIKTILAVLLLIIAYMIYQIDV